MKTAAVLESKPTGDRRPAAVFAIVKSTYARPLPADRAVNDEQFAAAGLDAWARHAAAANGFADAAAPLDAGGSRDITTHDIGVGNEHRAPLWLIVRAIGAAVADGGRSLAQRWREWRQVRQTYQALSGLDARTLRDIGVGDQEIGSIAAELAGRAERTRMQALRALRELTI